MLVEFAILSYNRPKNLKRVLDCFIDYNPNHFLISVYDDCSPDIKNISSIIDEYKSLLPSLRLFKHNRNIGYDLNLIFSIQNSSADYIIPLSDDDYIESSQLNSLYFELRDTEFDFGILPYFKNNWNRIFKKGYASPSDFIYDSILFSGLVFRPSFFKPHNFNFLSNKIYAQVYLGCLAHSKGSIRYLDTRLILLGGDGKNFFGHNQSSRDPMLMDRSEPFSNFIYQQKLLQVIQTFDLTFSSSFFHKYKYSFSIRVLASLFKIRSAFSFPAYVKLIPKLFCISFVFKPLLLMYKAVVIILCFCPSFICHWIYCFGLKFKKSG